jgi:putative tryptophan/tyrosine transport system substrate-binding protein
VGLLSLAVRGPDDFAGAFEAAVAEAPDALITLQDAITLTYRTQIIEFAAKRRLPALYPQREFADDGGLMVYGPNLRDLFRRSAQYVSEILKGANPAGLPIERPTTFDLVINLKTAQGLGLTLPREALQQATEVIQ